MENTSFKKLIEIKNRIKRQEQADEQYFYNIQQSLDDSFGLYPEFTAPKNRAFKKIHCEHGFVIQFFPNSFSKILVKPFENNQIKLRTPSEDRVDRFIRALFSIKPHGTKSNLDFYEDAK
jgi:hypothetical protein